MQKKAVVTVKFEVPCYGAKQALDHAREIIRRSEQLTDGGHGLPVAKYIVKNVGVSGVS